MTMSSWSVRSRRQNNTQPTHHPKRRKSKRKGREVTISDRTRKPWRPTSTVSNRPDEAIRICTVMERRVISTVTSPCPTFTRKSRDIHLTAKRWAHVLEEIVQIARAAQVSIAIATRAEVRVILLIAVSRAASKWRRLWWRSSNNRCRLMCRASSRTLDVTLVRRPSTRATLIISSSSDTTASSVAPRCVRPRTCLTFLSRFPRPFRTVIRRVATRCGTLTTISKQQRRSFDRHRRCRRRRWCPRHHRRWSWVRWVHL